MKMKSPIIALALIIASVPLKISAQVDSAYFHYNKAKEAFKAQASGLYYSHIKKALQFHPYHPTLVYEAGVAAAMNDNTTESLDLLKRALMLNVKVDLTRNELVSIKDNPQYRSLLDTQTEAQKTIAKSDTAFMIKDPTLHIECIAKGLTPNTFFFGSIHKRKIISTDSKGNIEEFTPSAANGLASVFGLKVDPQQKVLWACSSPLPEMENYDSTAISAVYKYDIKSKTLLAKFTSEEKTEHIFGDLILNKAGVPFISDSKNNVIYTVNEQKGILEKYFTSNEFWNIQGIAFDKNEDNLFIADYIKGLYKLNMATKQLTPLTQDFDLSLKSIDGLTYYNNSLIAIQNYINPMRVTRYFLDANETVLKSYEILDRAHPAFNEPTIGLVDGKSFYYVANSLWSGYDNNKKLKPLSELQNVVILKTTLNEKN